MKSLIALISSWLLIIPAVAGEPAACLTPKAIVRMSECELLELYRSGTASAPPQGFARGHPITRPGRCLTAARSRATRLLWQGKEFDCDGLGMINRVLGLRMVNADVRPGESWLDGKPTLEIDYQCTSKLFRDVRDEIREVAPGLFLGLTYLRDSKECKPVLFFVLDARCR